MHKIRTSNGATLVAKGPHQRGEASSATQFNDPGGGGFQRDRKAVKTDCFAGVRGVDLSEPKIR